jgi:cytochrome bd-type quinol oxidase subunit 2
LPQRIFLAEIQGFPIIVLSIREGTMLNALISVGGVLVGALIVSTVWLLGASLLEMTGNAKRKIGDLHDPGFHPSSAGNQS